MEGGQRWPRSQRARAAACAGALPLPSPDDIMTGRALTWYVLNVMERQGAAEEQRERECECPVRSGSSCFAKPPPSCFAKPPPVLRWAPTSPAAVQEAGHRQLQPPQSHNPHTRFASTCTRAEPLALPHPGPMHRSPHNQVKPLREGRCRVVGGVQRAGCHQVAAGPAHVAAGATRRRLLAQHLRRRRRAQWARVGDACARWRSVVAPAVGSATQGRRQAGVGSSPRLHMQRARAWIIPSLLSSPSTEAQPSATAIASRPVPQPKSRTSWPGCSRPSARSAWSAAATQASSTGFESNCRQHKRGGRVEAAAGVNAGGGGDLLLQRPWRTPRHRAHVLGLLAERPLALRPQLLAQFRLVDETLLSFARHLARSGALTLPRIR